MKPGEKAHEADRSNRTHDPELHRRILELKKTFSGNFCVPCFSKNSFQVRSNEVSEIGKMRQISFPAEELSTDLFLEFLNRPSQCWRGYVTFFGRPRE